MPVALLVVAVLALHLLLAWRASWLPVRMAAVPPPLIVRVLPSQPGAVSQRAAQAASGTPARQVPHRQRRPPTHRAPTVRRDDPPASPSPAPSAARATTASTGGAATGSAAGPAPNGDRAGQAGGAALGDAAPAAAGPARADAAADAFRLPNSATLNYDTFYNGMPNQTGTIVWSNIDEQRYRLSIAFSLPFVGHFAYASEGQLGPDGLAPDRYSEARSRRQTAITQFDRLATPPQARFSRGAAPVALPAGAQDRFSMLIQLAALVAGAPARYRPGVAHRFFVLDNDSGESWTMVVVGEETVVSHGQSIPALHLVRAPRRSGDARRIDVWLAATLQWLPVRLVQTEPDGTQLELRWRPPGSDASPAGGDEPMRGS